MIDKQKALEALRAAVNAKHAAWAAVDALAQVVRPTGIEQDELNALFEDVEIFASGADNPNDIGEDSINAFLGDWNHEH